MEPFRGPMLLAALCLVLLTKGSLATMSQCQLPDWQETLGPNPVTSKRGNVVLVAMFHGYCGYCIHQAGRLHELKTNLTQEGFPQIEMVIINGGGPRSRANVDNLIHAGPVPVVQDTPDNIMYRQVFQAFKDDFLVYDRCGQISFYIPHPYSNLRYNITSRVLKTVHNGDQPCYCSLDNPRNHNPDDMMMGDDPGVLSSGANTHTTVLGESTSLNCPPSDNMCQRFQRLLNRPRFSFGRGRRRGRRWRGRFGMGSRRPGDSGGGFDQNDGFRDIRRGGRFRQRGGGSFLNANSNNDRFNRLGRRLGRNGGFGTASRFGRRRGRFGGRL